ncbi:MAG TPA: M28 family peptidase [Gemmatimonadales bacterium]|nr:M28 family peptidase [Gemmatimonadales bacterium]
MRAPLLAALAAAAAVAACRKAPPPPREFDGQTAFGYLQTQVAFGPRIPNTRPHEQQAAWLDSLLRARADTLVTQRWSHVTAKGDTLRLTNFIARFNPAAATRVLYLAHWDTRPHADGPTSKDKRAPVPGANDGASGVAVLLGVADALKRRPPAIGVDLLFVDGEDYGDFGAEAQNDVLIGSRYYVQHPAPGPAPAFAVLWDLVADRNLNIKKEGNSLTGAPEIVDRVWGMARRLGYQRYFLDETGVTLIDDHVQLQNAGVPAIDVVDFDYPAWHTPDDTIDKVSAASLQIVGDVAAAVIRQPGVDAGGR